MTLFGELCELSEPDRAARLAVISAGHAELLPALQAMLEQDARSLSLLLDAPPPLVTPPPQLDAPVGIGPFRLLGLLGQGGMGTVWWGEALSDQVPVAVKLIRGEYAARQSFRDAFHAEVRAVAKLDHPGVVTVLDYGGLDAAGAAALGGVEGAPWLAMARVSGGSLSAAARVPAPWAVLRRILLQLLDALAHAHARGVLHLDIKPANVLLTEDGDVCLTDFGLAHLTQGHAEGQAAGTLAFMPPEQRAGAWRDFGPWTDLYAVGVVGWLLLHGELPGAAPRWSPRQEVPPAVEGWLRALLRPEARQRPQSAAEALRGLLQLAPGPCPVLATRPSADTARAMLPLAPPRPPLLRGAGLGLYGLRTLPLIGRHAECTALWTHLGGLWDSRRPAALALQGPAGVGKSHLARWLCETADAQGLAKVVSAALVPEAEEPMRHGALARLVEQVVAGQGLDPAALEARLRGRLSPADVELGLALLRPTPGPPPPPATPWRLLRAWLGTSTPLLIWLDDAQLSPSVLRGIRSALEAPGEALGPMLILLTLQSEALAEAPAAQAALEGLQEVGLSSLQLAAAGGADHAALLSQALQLSPALTEQLAQHTDGSPLFAVQLVGEWVQRGVLRPGPDGFGLAPGVEALTVPADLQGMWDERLARLTASLPGDAGPALELAAMLGQVVAPALWADACRAAGITLPPALPEALLRSSLARYTRSGELELIHSLLREAIRSRARSGPRWGLHSRCCADALEAMADGQDSGSLRERIAQHAEHGGDLVRALWSRARAIGRHLVNGDAAAAHAIIDAWPQQAEAAGLPPEAPAWGEFFVESAIFFQNYGDHARAARAFEQAHAGVEAYSWPVRGAVMAGYGLAAEIRGDQPEAARLYRVALQHMQTPIHTANAATNLARVLTGLGQLDEAEALLRDHQQRPLPDSTAGIAVRARILDVLSRTAFRRGDLAQARAWAEESLARYTSVRNLSGQFGSLLLLADASLALQDHEAHRAQVDRLLALSERLGREAMRAAQPHRLWQAILAGQAQAAAADAWVVLEQAHADRAGWIMNVLLPPCLAIAALTQDWPRCRELLGQLEALGQTSINPRAHQILSTQAEAAGQADLIAAAARLA